MLTKYSKVTLGRVEAVWNILGGEEGVERLLRGELSVSEPTRSWREQDGVIYLSVTSDGTTGSEWIKRLKEKGFRLDNYAKSILRSPDFKPTSGVTTETVVLKSMLFKDKDLVTKKIRAEADKRKLSKPNAEVACLIREKFSDEEIKAMSLSWIITMHEPIEDLDGDPNLLGAFCSDDHWLHAYYDLPGYRWFRGDGFAFVVSISSLS